MRSIAVNVVRAALLSGAVGVLAASILMPASAIGGVPAAKTCSTTGLHYSYTKNSTKFSDKVTDLRVSGDLTCSTARDLAAPVAKDLLHGRHVPARIEGLSVKVMNPCAGCSPVWHVTATASAVKVTFKVLGG